MASFSIVDDKISKNYKVKIVSIFEISEGSWNTSLKTNAFNIINNSLTETQRVLFTGYLSLLSVVPSNLPSQIQIKLRFNLNGSTNYIYESLNFFISESRQIIPINFVKTFTQPGLYDVYIYIEGTDFVSDTSDVLYLNATFCDIDTAGIFL